MTRKEMLRLLLNQAQFNGFEFRHWFVANVQPIWPGSEQALTLLAGEGRHYALLFSQEFASRFWQSGAQVSFSVPSMTYPRVNSLGKVVHVTRKPFTRRIMKPNAWKYHLSQMAVSADPVDYMAKFLPAHHQIAILNAQPFPMVAQA